MNSNLTTLSKKIVTGHGNLGIHDVSASFCIALFLCLSFMVGVLGKLRACWVRDPVYRPDMSATQSLVTFGGGVFTSITELAMSLHSYNQNTQSNNNPTTNVRLKSVFFLLNARKKRIASNLHFEQIKALADKNQGSVIKFQKMEPIS